jgi:hypothetical protein
LKMKNSFSLRETIVQRRWLHFWIAWIFFSLSLSAFSYHHL